MRFLQSICVIGIHGMKQAGGIAQLIGTFKARNGSVNISMPSCTLLNSSPLVLQFLSPVAQKFCTCEIETVSDILFHAIGHKIASFRLSKAILDSGF